MGNQKTLIVGSILSVILLLFLGWLQSEEAKFLNLSPQWLAIAVLPVLVALFAGGFITRFKGFGVELEATLRTPVASMNLTASGAVADIPGDEKKSFLYIDNLPDDKKLATRRLLFRSGRQDFYTPHGIERYAQELPNIKYFEIRTESGEIICFIPISTFRDTAQPRRALDFEKLKLLVQAIKQNEVPNAFKESAITLTVSNDQSLVDVLKKMRTESAEFAPVVSPTGKYLGVVFARDVERRIADSVLATTKASSA